MSRILAAVTAVLTLALLYAFRVRNANRTAALLGMILLRTTLYFARFEGTETYACSRELSTGMVESGGGLVGFLYD